MMLAKALLGLLARGEQHGYRMKCMVDAEYEPYWQVQAPQLYRTLARMTRAGWAKARTEIRSGPSRRVYVLTALGRQVLDEWLAEPAEDHDEFFVKWHLARDLGRPVDQLVERELQRIDAVHGVRVRAWHTAQAADDPGRVVVAEAALVQIQAERTAVELCAAERMGARGRMPLRMALAAVAMTGAEHGPYA